MFPDVLCLANSDIKELMGGRCSKVWILAASSEPKQHGCLEQKLLNIAGMMSRFAGRFTAAGPHNLPSFLWTEFQHFTPMFNEAECD